MSDVIIRPLDLDKDAERLAAMFNASDLQWPATWTRGVPVTAQNIRENEQYMRTLAVLVAEVDGEIAGYCNFMENAGRPGEGYLPLLNVQPKFQKLSIARRLIQATIDLSVKQGWQRQSLGTWPANFKAVPLYKKTGHFWTPGSAVWMQNFIPGALQLSLAKPFFARHDWYRSYRPNLTQQEDDQTWEGLKVFIEHWEADGEALTIWIDREARAPLAVEADAVQVAALVAEREPLAGGPVAMRWRVINKGQTPIQVDLHATGDEGLSLQHHAAFTVPAGETVERVAEVQVAENAPRSKDDGSVPAVHTLLHLDGQPVELHTGILARKPLRFDSAPAEITLRPGVAETVRLQVHSALKQAVTAGLWLTLPEGLAADWTQQTVTLPAEGQATLPVTLTAAREGVYVLPVRVECADVEGLKPLAETLHVFSVAGGGLVYERQGNTLRLETDTLRISLEAHGGTRVEDRHNRLGMARFEAMIGPPYFPSDFQKADFELALEERGGRLCVRRAAEARYAPGLYLHQELICSATGLLTCRYALENRGSQSYTRRLHVGVQTSDRLRERLTVPLQQGLVQSIATAYPLSFNDLPRDPVAYAEPWLAWERLDGELAAGVGWGERTAQIRQSGTEFESEELTLAPGERRDSASLALYVGRGGWRAVRETLRQWAGLPRPLEETQPRAVAQARVIPTLTLTTARTLVAQLRVDTVAPRASDGIITLSVQGPLTVEPQTVPVKGLRREQPMEAPLELRFPEGTLGVFKGQVHLSLPDAEQIQPFYVARLGTDTPVQVMRSKQAGQEVWEIANGRAVLRVAPGFGPGLIAWEEGGENQLYSAFPEPQGFSWTYPWFGGLTPSLYAGGGAFGVSTLYRESFSAEALQAQDADGLPWQGVRLSARPTHPDLKDLLLELDYLTLGDARVIRYVARLKNLRATEQVATLSFSVAASLGADPRALTLHGEGLTRHPLPWWVMSGGHRWGALTYAPSGKTLLLVSGARNVALQDWGQYGRTLGAAQEMRLAAGETRAQAYYLVLAESLEEAQAYVVFQDALR